MGDSEPHFALRQLQARLTSPGLLIGMASIAIVLGLSGPFGTYARLNLAERLVYWLAMVALTYLVGLIAATLALRPLRRHIRSPRLVELLAAALAGNPVTLVVIAINLIAFSGDPGVDPLILWPSCILISTLAMLVRQQLPMVAPAPAENVAPPAPDLPPSDRGDPPSAPSVAPPMPAILQRLPPERRGALLALSVEDHYVDVITSRGRDLVLIRLSDAIRETAPIAGVQIHRSHWVALAAVTRVERGNGRVLLQLSSGDVLPVSRGMMDQVRASGLFDRPE